MSNVTPKRMRLRQKFNVENGRKFVSSTDFICPICLQLIIYPVTMPCQHELCLECFQHHVQDTSLTCPMCRLRISTWTRKNAKANSLVNEKRWKLIQDLYPDRCSRRLNGEDDIDDSTGLQNEPAPAICQTGELRREYEEELKKARAEQQAETDQDSSFVQELAASELACHESEKKQLELDELTARQLQQEEMKLLGVKLMSPSEHQQKLLNLFRPKSPMRLRKRTLAIAEKSQCDKITKYFTRSASEAQCPTSGLSSKVCVSESSGINVDQEIAQKLQAQFDAEWRNVGDSSEPDKKPAGKHEMTCKVRTSSGRTVQEEKPARTTLQTRKKPFNHISSTITKKSMLSSLSANSFQKDNHSMGNLQRRC